MVDFVLENRGFNVYHTYPPVSEGELAAFEHQLGTRLPPQLRSFYLRWNGGLPYPADVPDDKSVMVRLRWKEGAAASRSGPAASFEGMFSINADPDIDFLRTWKDFRHRIPEDLLCFGYDPGNSLFLIGIRDYNLGQIYFWARSYQADIGAGETPGYDNIAPVADSFVAFLLALREEPREGESLEDWVQRAYGP